MPGAAVRFTPAVPFTSAPTDAPIRVGAEEDDDASSIPWWAILLIVLGVLVVLCILAAAVYLATRRKKPKRAQHAEPPPQPASAAPSSDYAYAPTAPPATTRDPGGDMQQWDSVQKPPPQAYGSPHQSDSALHQKHPYDDASYSRTSYATEDTNQTTSYGSEYAAGQGFQPGDPVNAQYIDGVWYSGTVWDVAPPDKLHPDGTYDIQWYDGSHSEGVPPEQIERR